MNKYVWLGKVMIILGSLALFGEILSIFFESSLLKEPWLVFVSAIAALFISFLFSGSAFVKYGKQNDQTSKRMKWASGIYFFIFGGVLLYILLRPLTILSKVNDVLLFAIVVLPGILLLLHIAAIVLIIIEKVQTR